MSDLVDQPRIREMREADIAAGLGLCRANRWNQVRRDWELFLQFSPRGCRVAVKNDQVVGTVTTMSYRGLEGRDRFHWIGMVMVDSAERRKGIGARLLREAIDLLGDRSAIRLDATPAGREVYRRLNFVDEYGLSRLESIGDGRAAWTEDTPARPMTVNDLTQVFEMDYEAFGADRGALLKQLFEASPEHSWVVRREGKIVGYTFGRVGHNFEHLGPVIAETGEIARQLVAACLRDRPSRPFILDVTRHDPAWTRWLESIGFREQRPYVRMVRGENRYPGAPHKQFAILGPEFG
jgi:predicted N-acetyltransferase YhbS